MTEWKAKRFWKESAVVETGAGWGITLDGRAVKTPSKLDLAVPTRPMAEAIATEWDAQEDVIDPRIMPMTRFANSAIEKVKPQRSAVIEYLAEYGDTDLLCYRADSPEGLVTMQSDGWDPLLDWASEALGARLLVAQGVMHVAQPANALEALRSRVDAFDDFSLAGFHDLVGLSGSLVLALAVTGGRVSVDAAWDLSRIDEAWQISQWGEDEEAAIAAAAKRAAFGEAARFFQLAQNLSTA